MLVSMCFSFIRYGKTSRLRHENMGRFLRSSLNTPAPNLGKSSVTSSTSTTSTASIVAATDLAPSISTVSSSTAPSLSDKKNTRFDGFEQAHWPFSDDKKCQSRCKLKGCDGQTHVYCSKCSADGKLVHLCFTKHRNCFVNYHDPNY